VRGVVAYRAVHRAGDQHQGPVVFAPPHTRLKGVGVGGRARAEAQVVALALEVAAQLAPRVGDHRSERGFASVFHGLDQQHRASGDLKIRPHVQRRRQ